MTKSNGIGPKSAEPVKQPAVAPGHPQSGGAFAVWGEGGIGPLMRRVRHEHQDHPIADPVTKADLAHLLDRFAGWPLPSELSDILIRELRGNRKGKPGPKITRSRWDDIQDALLISRYDRGLAIGRRLRSFLQHRQTKQSRSAKPHAIPLVRELACHYVRKRLPKFRNMTDASIANLVSRHRADSAEFEAAAR